MDMEWLRSGPGNRRASTPREAPEAYTNLQMLEQAAADGSLITPSIGTPDAIQRSPHDIWLGVSATAQTPAGAMLEW
jgi:hypothetical protein